MKKTVYYVSTLLLVLWVQMAVDYFIGATGLSFNVVLITVLYFGLAHGPLTGELTGFFWGLLVDASSLGLIGLHALLYAASGYFAGMLRRQLDEGKMWTQGIFTLIVSFLYVVFYLLFDHMFSPGPRPITWSLGVQPISNGIVAPLVFWLMQRWALLWDMLPQEE